MVFSNVVFLFLFLPAVLFLYFLIRTELRNILLVVFSLIFYAWGEPTYIILMLISIFINYIFGLLIDRFQAKASLKKLSLTLAIICNLLILGYFKYANFLITNINELFNTSIVLEPIALPIGISFYTFQALSYLIDVYRKNADVQKNVLHLALYISLFPQLIAGPIVRYNDIDQQIRTRIVTYNHVVTGVKRFIIGLAKKVLIANQMGLVADEIFSMSPDSMSIGLAWLGIIAYTLQIYFDFSGYSDMAIGLGKMFGFDFLENFRYPYISRSISEFWRRWHISLGNWFRDYVYIPLGGNRVSSFKVYRNLFIVWLLTGFWHGASWTFMAWGLYYGLFIALEKAGLSRLLSKLWRPLQHSYVLIIVIIGWVFFRADNFMYSFEFIQTMFAGNSTVLIDRTAQFYLHEYWYVYVLAIVCATPILPFLQEKMEQAKIAYISAFIKPIYYGLIFILSITYVANSTYNPFIYFRF
ncbi:MBOAT family protein [Bacillus sp. HMF5848]|uniref:MBOAT family O-acyltransferase n=1 Tax=Bacillus sp. HMF5848 TaxID=2495421 RepID=UPI000F7ADE72|nr:MBOAT family O-acyltransferase [Bacillus sp. HMF5848]RSK28525.1 MBOAT family protein [Bacillus sp. HMF5848]